MNIKKGEENSKMGLTTTSNYVKFVKGSTKAWANYTNKSDDTLYFIYDADNQNAGSLYLGSRLIGGASSASELTNVVLDAVGDKQLLIYDATTSTWKNGDISSIITVDDKSITKATVGTLSLKDFESAEVGTLASKGKDGNLSWVTPAAVIGNLGTYYTKTEVDKLISGQSTLSRKIVDSVNDIDTTATDADKYIYCIKDTSSSAENNTYTEYLVIDGKIEKVGDWATDLSGYVTKAEVGTLVTDKFNELTTAKIGDLSSFSAERPLTAVIGDLSKFSATKGSTLVDKIATIESQLTWSEITTD